jgi:hypothetical protein
MKLETENQPVLIQQLADSIFLKFPLTLTSFYNFLRLPLEIKGAFLDTNNVSSSKRVQG